MNSPNARTLILASILFAPVFAFAWTEPPLDPPGGNVFPPVNQSVTAQDKTGPLTLGGLSLLGNALLHIANPTSAGSIRYLNIANTSGDAGQGFRSNAGVLQFKSGANPWAPIVPSASGPSTHAQYAFVVDSATDWNYCIIPSIGSAVSCEVIPDVPSYNEIDIFGTKFGGPPPGWDVEEGSTGHWMIYKEIPGQTPTTPWTMCSQNGYTTPYDHQTRGYIVKKPDNRWYVYYYWSNNWDPLSKYRVNILASCWR
jgi:hypothetical protein